jgi:hypothetical protein
MGRRFGPRRDSHARRRSIGAARGRRLRASLRQRDDADAWEHTRAGVPFAVAWVGMAGVLRAYAISEQSVGAVVIMLVVLAILRVAWTGNWTEDDPASATVEREIGVLPAQMRCPRPRAWQHLWQRQTITAGHSRLVSERKSPVSSRVAPHEHSRSCNVPDQSVDDWACSARAPLRRGSLRVGRHAGGGGSGSRGSTRLGQALSAPGGGGTYAVTEMVRPAVSTA